MKYEEVWKKILSSDEPVKYEFSVGEGYVKFVYGLWRKLAIFTLTVSLLSMLGSVGLGIFGIVCAAIFFGIGTAYRAYKRKANAYAFTDRRVLIHKGWLSTSASSVNYDKITEVSASEPYMARAFFKCGNLSVHTGNVRDALVFRTISNPYEVKKVLDGLRNK